MQQVDRGTQKFLTVYAGVTRVGVGEVGSDVAEMGGP